MRLYGWKLGAGAGVLAGAGFLLLDGELLRETIWRLVLIGSCVGIVLGVRWHRPASKHPWWLLLAALALLTVANLATYPAWSTPTAAVVADYIAMLAFPLIGVAALALARLQAPGGDRESAIDGAIVMVAMATVLAGTVYRPDVFADDVTMAARLLNTVIAPLMMAAVAAATFRLLFVGSVRIVSAWFVVGAAAAGLFGNTMRALLTAEGTYERGTWSDVFILLAYAAIGLASLHPSSPQLTQEAAPRHRRFTHARLAVLGAALLAAPVTLAIRDTGDAWSVPVIASAVLSALVLWRLSGLVVERERTRRALHERVERQEALAEMGRQAIDDPDLERLTADAVDRCRDLLDLDRCRVGQAPTHEEDGVVALRIAEDGRMLVAERAGPWSDEDVAFLQAVANVLAGAIEREATHELIRRQAVQDALTGLPNRLALFDRLEQALAAHQRTREPLAVMFLDLDGFKRINDEYGHHAGDLLLIEVADRLAATVRTSDTVGRLAGDEFVVISERTDLEQASHVADRILAVLAEPVDVGGVRIHIGASIGIVVSVNAMLDAEHLLAQADHAMYTAKTRPGSATSAVEAHESGLRLAVGHTPGSHQPS